MTRPDPTFLPGKVYFSGVEMGTVYVDGARVPLFPQFVTGDLQTNRDAVRGALDGIAFTLTERAREARGPGRYVRVGFRSFQWRAET